MAAGQSTPSSSTGEGYRVGGTHSSRTPASSKKKKSRTSASATTSIKETCPSFSRGHLPSSEQVKKYRSLSAPHVESFDYFLETGLRAGTSDIVPSEIDIKDPRSAQRKRDSRRQLKAERGESDDESEVSSDEDRGTGGTAAEECDTAKFWVENVRVTPPIKVDAGPSSRARSEVGLFSSSASRSSASSSRLNPRECRELGIPYSGLLQGDFCYQFAHRKGDGTEVLGKVHRIPKRFGDMPIMIMSKACHLRGKTPKELMLMKEEVRYVEENVVG